MLRNVMTAVCVCALVLWAAVFGSAAKAEDGRWEYSPCAGEIEESLADQGQIFKVLVVGADAQTRVINLGIRAKFVTLEMQDRKSFNRVRQITRAHSGWVAVMPLHPSGIINGVVMEGAHSSVWFVPFEGKCVVAGSFGLYPEQF